jgi:hypothetical protein
MLWKMSKERLDYWLLHVVLTILRVKDKEWIHIQFGFLLILRTDNVSIFVSNNFIYNM